MNYIIRQATEHDIENIAYLENKCFSSEGWSSQSILDGIKVAGRYFFVAVNGDNHLGHACITNICGEGEITNVAIEEQFRRLGIGRKLMEKLIACGVEKGCNSFTLEVREGNQPAINLYKSLGFVSEGIRPHFYSNPDEGAVIMWKRE